MPVATAAGNSDALGLQADQPLRRLIGILNYQALMKGEFSFPTEGVFFTTATEHYRRAMRQAGKVRRYSAPRHYVSFHGFPTDEGLSLAIAALVGWATSIEAFTNHLYNKHVMGGLSPCFTHKRGSRNGSTLFRLRKLLQVASLAPPDVSWWPEITELFQVRRELVQHGQPHLSENFRYAPILRFRLTEQLLTNTWTAAMLAIDQLNILFHAPSQRSIGSTGNASAKPSSKRSEDERHLFSATEPDDDDIPY